MRSPHSLRLAILAALVLPIGLVVAAPTATDTDRADRQLDAYFRDHVARIERDCLADVRTKADWEKKRPEMRRQFLDMMGLWPLPARTDLKATVTGKIDAENFTVEKLHFQASPGLYVTGNLYIPKKAAFPAPAVLYVCGHASTIKDKVSYGNKVNYQHHGAWFAEHGYVCLIIDTLQLGELQGIHHGIYTHKMWWWQTLSYTSAGIECWNAMRAFDYLETRKEADPKRFGVTGISGGGATSWWVAAADDRVQCIVPCAGIADLYAHCCEGVATRFRKGIIGGHCDCMYMVNSYRWDFPMVAALCAPRPLMIGNSDDDVIFPQPSVRRLSNKVKRIYDLYGAGDKFTLWEVSGPHKDTPEMRRGAFTWMNRWLKNETGAIVDDDKHRFTPQQLKVVSNVPDDVANATIHESFIRPASIDLPKVPEVAREWWKGKSEEMRQELLQRVYAGWPQKAPPLGVKPVAEIKHVGLRLRAYDFLSEENVPLRVWLLTAADVDKPKLVVLNALDDKGWEDLLTELGPAFKDSLQVKDDPKLDEVKFNLTRRVLEKQQWGFAYVAPRGIGPTRWSESDTNTLLQIKRRYALIGQTLDGQRVWDVRRAFNVLKQTPDLKDVPVWLQGKGEMAGIVLYAAIFEPEVARLDLWNPPASHRDGPTFLNVRRILDMPQAMALAFPRPIRVYIEQDAEARQWDWPVQLQKALGKEDKDEYLKIRKVSN